MKKTDKNNILIIVIIVFALAVASLYFVFNKKDPTSEKKPQISVLQYEVYDYDKVDFRFIIAKLAVESEKDLNIPLKEIFAQDISLDKRHDFIKKLRDNNYSDDFSKIDDALISENSKSSVLFIPVLDNDLEMLTLTSEHFDDITFDLTKNIVKSNNDDNNDQIDNDDEAKDDSSQIIEAVGYKMIVHSVFNMRDFTYYFDNIQHQSASSEVLHIFEVKLQSMDKKTYEITDAKFIFKDSGVELQVEDTNFKTSEHESLLNKKTNDEITGYLMFLTYSQDLAPVRYKGTLLIKVNNGDWLEIEVGL